MCWFTFTKAEKSNKITHAHAQCQVNLVDIKYEHIVYTAQHNALGLKHEFRWGGTLIG